MAPFRVPGLQIEIATTRDVQVEEPDGTWTSRPCAPPGTGWRVADASDEKRTTWRRLTVGASSAASLAPSFYGGR